MRIPIQTGNGDRLGFGGARIAWALLAAALFSAAGWAHAQTGAIRCTVTENGAPARGTFEAAQSGKQVGAGSCGDPLALPPGRYEVSVTLDGALDSPTKTTSVAVTAGKTTPLTTDFKTGVLEVQIESKARGGTAQITVSRGSERIGTLGSNVPARLSAGTYAVVVRLGGQEQRYDVDLRPGQRRLVRAQF